ncbi:hypothetical protein J4408_00255 [Candidatus Pacearchaeota archaeon]|nr:hypothetical protein [Candidatus Pacearchaeota archaeon]
MAERDLVTKEKMDFSGIFDFGGLYSFAHRWFKNEGYDGVTEESYSEKVSGNSRDVFIEWKITKQISDYFKIEHKVRFEITGLTDVEVEIDGKKKKMNKGKVVVEIKSALVKDPDSKWESSPTNKFLRDVYNKYIIPGRVEDVRGKVQGDAIAFKEEVKAYLELIGKR